jgi:hypothetical protein
LEILIIIFAIVFSVWSEMNKKKNEADLDLDLSDLSSIDDFLKKPSKVKNGQITGSGFANSSYSAPPPPPPIPASISRKSNKGRKKQAQKSFDGEHQKSKHVNYDEIATRKDVNYDKLPSLTSESYSQSNSELLASLHHKDGQKKNVANELFQITPNQMVKSFILSEVLTRYDINRIYDRIPSVRQEED